MIRSDGTLAPAARLGLLLLLGVGAYLALADPFTIVFFSSYAVVAAILVIRRPRQPVSWLLLAIAFAFVGTTSGPGVDVAAMIAGRGTPIDNVWAWAYSWSWIVLFLTFASLAFVFPTGRLPRGRFGLIARVGLGLLGVVGVLSMFFPTLSLSVPGDRMIEVPNPFAVAPDLGVWTIVPPVAIVAAVSVLVAGVASLLARYRTSSDVHRLQLKWLLAAMGFMLAGVLAGIGLELVLGPDIGGFAYLGAAVAYPTIPIAIAVAILRYRLFEIDRIVNRAVVYGAVTAILAGVFAGATALSQRLFIVVTGETSDAAVVLTTLAVATLYAPVRKRVESAVDRVLKYDQRQYGPYRDQLARLLELVDPARAAEKLAAEVQRETGAQAVTVLGRGGEPVATVGTAPEAEPVEVRVDGAHVTAVLLGSRRDGRPHEARRLEAVAEIARLADEAIPGPPRRRRPRPPAVGEAASAHVFEPEVAGTEVVEATPPVISA